MGGIEGRGDTSELGEHDSARCGEGHRARMQGGMLAECTDQAGAPPGPAP